MKYPIGIQNFESLRKDGYTYVDKTAMIYQLASQGRYYFLSRPRRFGKSLLLSTLEAYFAGKRGLFRGLAVEKLEKDWTAFPILHLDLNTARYSSRESLDEILNDTLTTWEKAYGREPAETTLALRFKGIVRRAVEQSGRRVVILVDEYDKPLLQTLDNKALQAEYRSTLKAFYSVLKSQDQYIRFALLTGVTKFGKVSVFSDLNNLFDLSMDERYQSLCGITEEEIHAYFGESVRELAGRLGLTVEETLARLREQYDGYHFVENGVGIYNPFSLLNTFQRLRFGSYWFETGTPTYLVELLQRDDYVLPNLTEEVATADVLNSIDSFSSN
ncbi:ATP-binding protein, partial [Prevotella multiformis]